MISNSEVENITISNLHSEKVYIVLVNWNGWADTIECLSSIYNSIYRNFQIIIVDNDSTDNSADYIKLWAESSLCPWVSLHNPMRELSFPQTTNIIPLVEYGRDEAESGGNYIDEKTKYAQLPVNVLHPLILIHAGDNVGFGTGNNIAFKYILSKNDFKYVWLLNNDTVITSRSMSQMFDSAQRHSGITGSILMYYSEPNKVQAYGGGYFSALTGRVMTMNKVNSRDLNFITGASFMLDKRVLDVVGFFDERIFMYFEDADYCIRAANKKISCLCSDALVFHKEGGSTSSGSYFSWLNVYKNKFYSMKKNFGLGPWFFIYVGSLILNIVMPSVDINKKRASKDALFEIITRR